MPRKKYAGGAVATKLNGPINNATTTVVLVDASTYPSGADPFVIAVDRGTASEEKMLCTRVALSATVTATRGYDGTTPVAHNDQAVVEHVLDALSIDEANQFANTMTANGDLLTRSGGNPAAVTVGSAGQVLGVASGLPTWRDLTPGNAVINGGFAVNQRGTAAVTTDSAYLSDRWQLLTGSPSSPSAQSVAFGTSDRISGAGEQFARFMSVSGTLSNAVTGYILARQVIEDVRTFAGQTVTLSFWAKASTAGTLGVRLQQRFDNGGTGDYDVNMSVSVTTSWQRLSLVTTLPSLGTKTIGANSYLVVVFDKLIGTGLAPLVGTITGTLSLTGVQLEVGSAATPFVARPFQQELAMCQRYFRRFGGRNLYEYFGQGFTYNASNGTIYLPLSPEMRTTPAFGVGPSPTSVIAPVGGFVTGYLITSAALAAASTRAMAVLDFQSAGMPSNVPCVARGENNLNAYWDFSAEF